MALPLVPLLGAVAVGALAFGKKGKKASTSTSSSSTTPPPSTSSSSTTPPPSTMDPGAALALGIVSQLMNPANVAQIGGFFSGGRSYDAGGTAPGSHGAFSYATPDED